MNGEKRMAQQKLFSRGLLLAKRSCQAAYAATVKVLWYGIRIGKLNCFIGFGNFGCATVYTMNSNAVTVHEEMAERKEMSVYVLIRYDPPKYEWEKAKQVRWALK
jgi:hypothetical protein